MTKQDTILDIIGAARRIGACARIDGATDIGSLASLLFSPQGKEFCTEHNFPSLQAFRELNKAFDMPKYGVYVDSNAVSLHNQGNIALIGKTQGELTYDGVERKYTVILKHGAKATIKARNYAVIEVVSVGCKVEYDIDETVILL